MSLFPVSRCECPYLFDGPNCQQTKRSFNDGYATFSTLRQCEETSLSIEFITETPSGTLFYNGPIQPIEGDDAIDMILLELLDSKAKLTINLGSVDGANVTLELEVPKDNLGDGQWHRIDVYRNGRVRTVLILSLVGQGDQMSFGKILISICHSPPKW